MTRGGTLLISCIALLLLGLIAADPWAHTAHADNGSHVRAGEKRDASAGDSCFHNEGHAERQQEARGSRSGTGAKREGEGEEEEASLFFWDVHDGHA
eukprot:560519-Hanusia_phi.AAC.1